MLRDWKWRPSLTAQFSTGFYCFQLSIISLDKTKTKPSLHPISPFPPSNNHVESISASDNYSHTKGKFSNASHRWDNSNGSRKRPNWKPQCLYHPPQQMLLGLLNTSFSSHSEEGGEKEETKICSIFRAQLELQKEKLKEAFPVSADSTWPMYLTSLYSNYFMPELCFQIPHAAVCLECCLQQS